MQYSPEDQNIFYSFKYLIKSSRHFRIRRRTSHFIPLLQAHVYEVDRINSFTATIYMQNHLFCGKSFFITHINVKHRRNLRYSNRYD